MAAWQDITMQSYSYLDEPLPLSVLSLMPNIFIYSNIKLKQHNKPLLECNRAKIKGAIYTPVVGAGPSLVQIHNKYR